MFVEQDQNRHAESVWGFRPPVVTDLTIASWQARQIQLFESALESKKPASCQTCIPAFTTTFAICCYVRSYFFRLTAIKPCAVMNRYRQPST